jgi:hypothetical protein
MFRNREIRIKLAKTNAPTEETSDTKTFPFEDPEVMKDIAVDFLKKTAVVVGCVLVVSTVLHTLSEIAINASKKNDE